MRIEPPRTTLDRGVTQTIAIRVLYMLTWIILYFIVLEYISGVNNSQWTPCIQCIHVPLLKRCWRGHSRLLVKLPHRRTRLRLRASPSERRSATSGHLGYCTSIGPLLARECRFRLPRPVSLSGALVPISSSFFVPWFCLVLLSQALG